MFTSARLKLTGWYLLIIMTISILFSIALYLLLSSEFDRGFGRIQRRYGQMSIFPNNMQSSPLDEEILESSKDSIRNNLISINIFILLGSATAGYFLAGMTLKPIGEMVEEQNRFITDASHELRTPLTALRTSLEVYLRDKDLNLKDAKEVLKSSLIEVENLQSLSDNLLIFAKGQGSRVDLELTFFSLKKTIADAVAKLDLLAQKKKIGITQEVPDLKIEADQEKIMRLMIILIDNAIKYSPKGGAIIISAQKTDHKIKINIIDHGLGIEEQDKEHIFDRFYRASQSRFKTEGHGLGLAIAKKIVGLHRGIITVKSKVGQGSTFTVIIPT